jgi:hypothetical protein
MLQSPIRAKQQSEQSPLRMSFPPAEGSTGRKRKRIEAQGIAAFRKTVTPGINVQWIRNSKNGLPPVLEPN